MVWTVLHIHPTSQYIHLKFVLTLIADAYFNGVITPFVVLEMASLQARSLRSIYRNEWMETKG